MVVQSTVCQPVFGIQIAVHQELGEGEETEHHRIGLYFPSRLARNSLRDARCTAISTSSSSPKSSIFIPNSPSIFAWSERFVDGGSARDARSKSIGSAAPLDPNRKQDEGRETFDVRFVVLEPFQQTEGQIKDVDALFFFERPRIIPMSRRRF